MLKNYYEWKGRNKYIYSGIKLYLNYSITRGFLPCVTSSMTTFYVPKAMFYRAAHMPGETGKLFQRLLEIPALRLQLVFLGHLDVVKRQVMVHDDLLVVEMVGNHADDVDRQRADPPSVQNVVQAVPEPGNHN